MADQSQRFDTAHGNTQQQTDTAFGVAAQRQPPSSSDIRAPITRRHR